MRLKKYILMYSYQGIVREAQNTFDHIFEGSGTVVTVSGKLTNPNCVELNAKFNKEG